MKEKIFSRTFIFMTILFPVLMFGIIGAQALIMSFEGDNDTALVIATENQQLTERFQNEFLQSSLVKENHYRISYETVEKNNFDDFLKSKKQDILNEKLAGIVFIPNTATTDKKIEYYSKTPKNFTISEKLERPINKVLLDNYFSGKNLSDQELTYARSGIDFTGFKVTSDEKVEEEGYGNLILSYLFTFLLYISLIMMGQSVMLSVIEEKNNKIVEIMLSSVSSKELMAGKILGSSLTGLLQMAIWLMPLILVISTTWFALPQDIVIDISFYHIGYFLINFFIGLVTFMGLFATVGSIFENSQEAQSGLWPIMMLIIIPFFIAFSLFKNPANPIGVVSSMLPFAAIMVMPARLTLVDIPIWQILISFAVNIGTLFLIFPVAGKIFRVGILRTGKKPKWSEIFRWLKYKY